jgi:hypothetical protein
MADHAHQELTRLTLRRTGLVSVNADFLHCAGGASAFLCAFRNSRGEESFTPVLHWALDRSLHRNPGGKARQVHRMGVLKTLGLREGWNDVRAGATPLLDARCVSVAVRSLPPSQELRGCVLRGRIHRPENLSDRMSDSLHEHERRNHCRFGNPTKTTQGRYRSSPSRRIGKVSTRAVC